MSGKIPIYRTRWFQLTIGLIVSLFCLGLAVRPILQVPQGFQKIVAAFRQADYRSLPLIFVVLFVFFWLKAWRWRLMLLPVGRYRPLKDLFGPILIGFAFNNALPARIGEFVRCYVFSRQQRLPLVISISSVVLERIFDGMSVVLYLTLGLIFVRGINPAIQHQAYVVAALSGALVLFVGSYVVWTKPFVALTERVLRLFPFIPRGLTDKVCRLLEEGARGLSSLKDVRLFAAMVVISLVKWGLNAFLFWISLWSFEIDVGAPAVMTLMGVVALGVALPQAPGYFGVMQLCFMVVLSLFKIPPERIFAASIYYQISQFIPVTITGFVFFFLTGLSVRQVEQEEDRLEEADPATPLL